MTPRVNCLDQVGCVAHYPHYIIMDNSLSLTDVVANLMELERRESLAARTASIVSAVTEACEIPK